MEMPSFLQSKQDVQSTGFKGGSFFKDRKKLSIVSLVILLLAIPVTVWLAQRTQIFAPKADIKPIELVAGNGSCVVSTDPNKVSCATFPIRLTSIFNPLSSPTPTASPTASDSPLPSPSVISSPSPSSAVSPSPSPSPAVSVASCMSTQLGLSAPQTIANKNNTTILYWKSPVSFSQLTAAASECGASLLNPTNFSSQTMETFVRNNSGSTIRSVWVEGPCTAQKVNDYRNNGIKVSPDVQCDAPLLDYKVYPSVNEFDGIGDYKVDENGDPAVVISGAQSFIQNGFFKLLSLLVGNVDAQTNNASACLSAALSLGNPVTAPNTKQTGTNLVFWNQLVDRQTFNTKAQECGALVLAPGNFLNTDVKSLVETITGMPTSTSDNSKYRNIIVEGPCSTQKINDYRNAGHVVLADSQCDEIGVDLKINQYHGPGSGANPFGVYSGIADEDEGGYPVIITSSVNSSSAPSDNPANGTLEYRLAETEAGLATAEFEPYDSHPVITDFTFADSTPGFKQIWVEFVSINNESRIEHISVELIEPEPVITSLDCSMDISKQDLKITLNGLRLGSGSGKVVVGAKEAQILAWGENQVTATFKPDGTLDDGRSFKVVLTKGDGKVLPEVTCLVNTTLISLGARLFCREPGKFDVNGVSVVLVDENGNRVNESVTIDKDGIIKNLKTKLQVGKLYAIAVKAPFSLRRVAQFMAANGTNVINDNDSPFILPVGDIAPVILNDGKINTLDRSEIVRQWSVLGSNIKTGDFNRDTKVNSIDWACMRYDFNKEDEVIPSRADMVDPSPLPSSNASAIPSASMSASSSPQASVGQRAAYFLIEPVEGGSYPNGDEFIVNINLWSQNEAANLFVAKLSFDPAALEVVRIEKGTALTSWAEEFFDNPTGQISLTAGLPSPGLKTTEGNDALMAKVIFKGKKTGITTLSVTQNAKIYSNADNQNILTSLLSSQIAITE